MNLHARTRTLPPSIMMWTINDTVIEDPAELTRRFHAIRRKGFGGVAVFVRCSRYCWSDPEAIEAVKRIGRLCRPHRLALWVGLDPRSISHRILGTGGLHVLVTGTSTNDGLIRIDPVVDHRYRMRCNYSPRPVHTMNEGAVTYRPLDLFRVYAFRNRDGWYDKGTHYVQPLKTRDVLDVTRYAHFHHNASDGYAEAFGVLSLPASDAWSICVFFRFQTNHFDYSSKTDLTRYFSELRKVFRHGLRADGIVWDEPGYTCTQGMYPYSDAIERMFERKAGVKLSGEIWKLAAPSKDGSHEHFRENYFRVIQDFVIRAQLEAWRVSNAESRRKLVCGIHDTWRWESADMRDMNHGSLDVWRGLRSKSAGFVDLGSVNLLRKPNSPFYRNLAAACVLGSSLGRESRERVTVNNLWTTGPGARWQNGLLSHCVDVMALFGHRWLAHIFGPAGILGREESFLGLPFTPGYPAHSTWSGMNRWNRRLARHFELVEGRLPEANILFVFPVGAMYRLGDKRAGVLCEIIFSMLLYLMDAHFHVHMISDGTMVPRSGIQNRSGDVRRRFDALIHPSFESAVERTAGTPMSLHESSLLRISLSESALQREPTDRRDSPITAFILDELDSFTRAHRDLRLVDAPEGSWSSVTRLRHGTVVTLVPSRFGGSYSGRVSYNGREYRIRRRKGMLRLFFPRRGEASVLT